MNYLGTIELFRSLQECQHHQQLCFMPEHVAWERKEKMRPLGVDRDKVIASAADLDCVTLNV